MSLADAYHSSDVEKHSEPASDLEHDAAIHGQGLNPDVKHGLGDELIEDLALRGHVVATDGHGRALVTIDPEAERRLRWKIDLHVMPIVMLMYLWCFIDRANIGNARLYGLAKDLGLVNNDYNIVLTCFYISYVLLEYPVVLMNKVIGPGRWIPFLVFMFGIISLCTAFVQNFSALCGVRFLLGLFESGLLPGLAYYLSRWYRKGELVFRLSLYIAMAPLAGAFSGLLAYGIVNDLTHIGWLTRWRMLFFIEGLVTIFVGICSFILLTDRPESARWLNKEEKALAETRIKVDTVAVSEAIEGAHHQTMLAGIFNINVWSIGFILLVNSQMVQGIAVFLPTIIATQYPKDTAVIQNLLTVPCYIAGMIWVLVISYASWKTRRHAIYVIICSPFAIAGYSLFLSGPNTGAKYTGAFFVAMGSFPMGSLLNGWIAANASPDTTRASAIAVGAVLQNIGGLISSWTYLAADGPRYVPGHSFGIACGASQLIAAALIWAYQSWENKQREMGKRDHRLDGLSPAEISLLGHRHPEFRYTH